MRFSVVSIIAALAAVATANTIEFINQDTTTRTIYFTPSAGMAAIKSVTLGAGALNTTSVTFPTGWIGNWYSVNKGAQNVPGMLGEVAWNGWAGNHYFDVSAIVNAKDNNGVKMMYPKKSLKPVSGCQDFGKTCTNAYNLPDDIQTLATTEDTIVCLLGTKSSSGSVSRRHAREFITGDHAE